MNLFILYYYFLLFFNTYSTSFLTHIIIFSFKAFLFLPSLSLFRCDMRNYFFQLNFFYHPLMLYTLMTWNISNIETMFTNVYKHAQSMPMEAWDSNLFVWLASQLQLRGAWLILMKKNLQMTSIKDEFLNQHFFCVLRSNRAKGKTTWWKINFHYFSGGIKKAEVWLRSWPTVKCIPSRVIPWYR